MRYIKKGVFLIITCDTMSITIRLHLVEETVEKLADISKVTDRSKSQLIREAISQYLAEYTDYQIALDRLHDSSDDVISSEEMRNLLVNED